MPIRAGPPNPPRPFPLKQSSILSTCACSAASLPPEPTEPSSARIGVKKLHRSVLHLTVPEMPSGGIEEIDGLGALAAGRDLLGVHMPPPFGYVAEGLIAPGREAAGGDHHPNEQKGHEPDRPTFTSVTHDTKPRQHATLSLHSPVDISPVLDPQDFYRSHLVVYVVEYPDLPQP